MFYCNPPKICKVYLFPNTLRCQILGYCSFSIMTINCEAKQIPRIHSYRYKFYMQRSRLNVHCIQCPVERPITTFHLLLHSLMHDYSGRLLIYSYCPNKSICFEQSVCLFLYSPIFSIPFQKSVSILQMLYSVLYQLQ